MKVVCGWCGILIKSGDPEPVSHGMCPKCQVAFVGGRGPVKLKEFIDGFEFPVVVVTSNVELIDANAEALKFVGKDFVDVEGHLGGEVMECIHAKQPCGCGKAVHCKACTIRNSVSSTYRTGTPVIDALAYQEMVTQDGVKRVHLRISTMKASDSVLLKMVPV